MYPKIKFIAKNWSDLCNFYSKVFQFWNFCLRKYCLLFFAEFKYLIFHNRIVKISEKIISKTRLYNFDPIEPHFYILKLGYTGVYIIFLISTQKHRLWVLVRTALLRWFSRVPTMYALSRNVKISEFFI